MNTNRLYFAYGANTDRDGMTYRCPGARAIGRVTLRGYRLAFRGVADVVADPNAIVSGVLWEISAECERSLDRFESFPNLYVKRESPIKINGEMRRVMFYVMRRSGDEFSPPPRSYEETLRRGYHAFGVDTTQIDRAVAEAKRSNSLPPFRSKWHKIDAGEMELSRTFTQSKPQQPQQPQPEAAKAAATARGLPLSWDSNWRAPTLRSDRNDLAARIERARRAPLPNPKPIEPKPRDPRLLAVPSVQPDIFKELAALAKRGQK